MTERMGVGNRDMIRAIISKSSAKSFKRNWTKIHAFFFGIKSDSSFGYLFEDLMFDTNGPYPYCEELETILSEFQSTGIIGSHNPALRDYTINISEEDFEQTTTALRRNDKDKIEEISRKFSEELGIMQQQVVGINQ